MGRDGLLGALCSAMGASWDSGNDSGVSESRAKFLKHFFPLDGEKERMGVGVGGRTKTYTHVFMHAHARTDSLFLSLYVFLCFASPTHARWRTHARARERAQSIAREREQFNIVHNIVVIVFYFGDRSSCTAVYPSPFCLHKMLGIH